MESVESISQIVKPWIDDTGWFHFHPQSDPRHFELGFPDAPHHTAFYYFAKILIGEYDRKTLRPLSWSDEFNFRKGLDARLRGDGKIIRHPRTLLLNGNPELIGYDNLKLLTFVIGYFNHAEAEKIWEANRPRFLFPHQWVFSRRERRKLTWKPLAWVCDLFEFPDMLADLIKTSHSSLIKNAARLALAVKREPNWVNRLAWWSLHKLFKMREAFRVYFTRSPDHNPADNPFPCHLIWNLLFTKMGK